MTGWEESPHRCPECGSGARWTTPLQPDEGHELRALLYCGECGAFLGQEHAWHDLGTGDAAETSGTVPLRQWLRLYRRARRLRARHATAHHAARQPKGAHCADLSDVGDPVSSQVAGATSAAQPIMRPSGDG